MKSIALLILIATTSLLQAEKTSIPSDIARLNEQRNREIAKIDKVYKAQLEKLLKAYTQKGDLNSANYINSILNQLNAKEDNKNLPKTDKELTTFIGDTAWKFPDGKVITFMRNGKMKKNFGVLEPEWKVENLSIICEGKIFSFNKAYTDLTETTKQAFKGSATQTPQN
jgi:hypothetical protein